MDVRNSVKAIRKGLSIIYRYIIMRYYGFITTDIHKSITNVHTWIIDTHNIIASWINPKFKINLNWIVDIHNWIIFIIMDKYIFFIRCWLSICFE